MTKPIRGEALSVGQGRQDQAEKRKRRLSADHRTGGATRKSAKCSVATCLCGTIREVLVFVSIQMENPGYNPACDDRTRVSMEHGESWKLRIGQAYPTH